MKYGVIVFRDTRNIGDDIQSYAASRLLPHVDEYIDREHLNTFLPQDREPVAVIMNAWYMYNPLCWPPSPFIDPLYISMHFSKDFMYGIGADFYDTVGKDALLPHAPIGCRDLQTKALLEDHGIPAWFSGCMTLTLSPVGPSEPTDIVYLSDLAPAAETWLRQRWPQVRFEKVTHELDERVNASLSMQERFANVEALLTRYQNARAVITSRLHCALPCLALNTPVLLVTESLTFEPSRFSGLDQFVRSTDCVTFINNGYDFDLTSPPENPKGFIPVREQLIASVQYFVKASEEHAPSAQACMAAYQANMNAAPAEKAKRLEQCTDALMQAYLLQMRTEYELQKAQIENENLAAQLALITGSVSWRVGQVVTYPPRTVHNLLKGNSVFMKKAQACCDHLFNFGFPSHSPRRKKRLLLALLNHAK